MMSRTTSIPAAPRATLSTEVDVVNFSSPHPFKFVDGTILAACDPERVKALPLERRYTVLMDHGNRRDVRVVFLPTEAVLEELTALEADETIDIIIVPRIVLDGLGWIGRPAGKARTIMLAERDHGESREKINRIDCFCV